MSWTKHLLKCLDTKTKEAKLIRFTLTNSESFLDARLRDTRLQIFSMERVFIFDPAMLFPKVQMAFFFKAKLIS